LALAWDRLVGLEDKVKFKLTNTGSTWPPSARGYTTRFARFHAPMIKESNPFRRQVSQTVVVTTNPDRKTEEQ